MNAFPDFLSLMADLSSDATYYQQCAKLKLERQVGTIDAELNCVH